MKAPDAVFVDFESFPIRQRPHFPPKPVGVATKWPGQPSQYLAWGHPTANNGTLEQGMAELDQVWRSGLPIVFHNSKFDVAVATEGLGFPMPPWDRLHDTMFLAYLCDPHSRSIALKELAADLLNWPAEEQDAIVEWVMANADRLPMLPNRKGELKRPSRSSKSPDSVYAGAWIAWTPGDLCGRYACGDTDRTAGLWEHCWPLVQANGMGAAYDRERAVMPIFLRNEREGMLTDVEALSVDIPKYEGSMEIVETALRGRLGVPDLNLDSDDDVAQALLNTGVVPEANFVLTPSGKLSTSKDNLLPSMFTDPAVASALGYRNRLTTCLNMFMKPWFAQASEWGGKIGTNWNQTRNPEGGTRTGRPSTNKHNFLNVSKAWDGRDDGYTHPEFLSVSTLPLCRTYILPDAGHTFLHRDFDGQELRVFAHFEQGDLWDKYAENPDLDPHTFIGDELKRVAGREIERTRVKTLNFQGLYGGGEPALMRKLRCTKQEAKELKKFHNEALPGRVTLNDEIKRVIGRGSAIVTWGGRLYFAEPPGPDGRSKVYKLINYIIQGSAADLTKEALIAWDRANHSARFMVTVYDEINISSPKDDAARNMRILKEAMETARLTVPMTSSPKHGASWGKAKACTIPGTKKIDRSCPLCA